MRGMVGIIDSIDQQVPSGSFSSPAPGNVSGVITLTVNASDYDQVASVQFKIDGVNIGSPDTVAPYTTTYDTRALLNGVHTFSAVVTDRVGNTTTTTVNVTFANAPVIVITAPANGANVTGNTSFTASVTSYDASVSTQFKVDGTNYGAAQPGTGSVGFGSVDTRGWLNGNHTWSVTATDGHGNATSASITVNHVNAPTITLLAPANAATVAGNVAFNATIVSYDASATTQWKVDGVNYGSPISGAAPNIASVDTRQWLNGSHTITAVVTDSHSNSASASVTVTYANAPVVSITAPANAATLSGAFAYTATVTHYDNSCTTAFKVDGANYGAAQSGGGSLTAGSPDSRSWLNGSHTLAVTAVDGYGNTTTASITVTFNNAPVVQITSPGNGATVSASNAFNATVTSYDATVSTQFKVDGANFGGAQSGAGGKGVTVESRSYLNGWHTYSVTVTDGHSNTATASFSIYHRNAPVVGVTNPSNGGTYYNNFSFRANITIYSGSATSRYYIDGGEWNNTGAVGSNVGWDNLDSHYLAVGWHNFRVITTDAEGNTGQSEVNMYVNNQVPGGGYITWGDLQQWWDDADFTGWTSYRSTPPDYDNRWGGSLAEPLGAGSWWSGPGQGAGAYPYMYLPGNPDPTHYQMRARWNNYDSVEGGSDGNIVIFAWNIPGYGEIEMWRNGDVGNVLNVGGGEWIRMLRYATWPGNNNSFSRGIRAYYDFVLKGGYAS